MSAGDLFLGLIAILFPPIAVWIKRGLCSCDSIINLALCMLGYFPGLLHAWYIIFTYPEYDYDYVPVADEEARVTYVVQPQQYQYQGNEDGPSTAPPPAYDEAIRGDHKIQTRD
ncbi:hypothetical protein DV735_g96, partial [Chaetothyriales sp. CBS 134920]